MKKLRERLMNDTTRVGVPAPARACAGTGMGVRYAPAPKYARWTGATPLVRSIVNGRRRELHGPARSHTVAGSLVAAVLLISASLAAAGISWAQSPTRAVSAHLDPDHWAVAAAQRLAALGLAPDGFGWGERALSIHEVRRVFRTAAERAPVEAPAYAALARDYLDRFDEEFGASPWSEEESGYGAARGLTGSLDAGYSLREGRVLAGVGYNNEDDWTGAIPANDVSTPFAGGTLRLAAHPRFALEVAAQYDDQDPDIRGAEVRASWRNVAAWVGRRRMGFGPGAGGGIVLTGIESLDAVGLESLDPFALPGPLGHLGAIRIEAAFSRIQNGDRIRDPWFWVGRLAFEPHRRLQIGLTRAVMLGGEGNSAWTPRNVLYALIGKHAGEMGEFDNQVLAFDVHYRPPLGAIPLLLYLEWGLDDSAGAFKDVPAIVAGVFVPSIPIFPSASLRLEHTVFDEACCGNTIWYRNWAFRGGWTDAGIPLGHPLGGHGREWLAELRTDLHEARLRMAVGARLRHRGDENLFAPQRTGDAVGVWLRGALRASRRIEVFVAGAVERGEADWEERSLDIGMRWLYR
ncbi:MAG: capsule assembly Wzi family protein [Gemmatimonadota bacterium]